MVVMQERLKDACEQFGWSRIPEILHTHAEEAAKYNHSYLEFLDKLLQEELVCRHERFIRMKTRMARLPYHKTLEQFDFSFQPSIDERRIRDLAMLRFIEHQENLILLGPPGVGKTHLAVALALEAIKQRYTVYFTTAHDLVQTLQQAQHSNTVAQRMKALTKPNLLIIDEIGYRRMDDTAAHFFFQIGCSTTPVPSTSKERATGSRKRKKLAFFDQTPTMSQRLSSNNLRGHRPPRGAYPYPFWGIFKCRF